MHHLSSWLAGWLAGRPACWPACWLAGVLAGLSKITTCPEIMPKDLTRWTDVEENVKFRRGGIFKNSLEISLEMPLLLACSYCCCCSALFPLGLIGPFARACSKYMFFTMFWSTIAKKPRFLQVFRPRGWKQLLKSACSETSVFTMCYTLLFKHISFYNKNDA